eukprot:CAMPEP_0113716978 /NCGR_PEP_ID=MMETSP0038_2-20120614/34233_1 /TAXON_ID=2898 /ORGANISM="Cryptomonas paramecium" /LENGTH=43 /DNA_ID=CAMNT_0000644647 /DNA_START=69 /DNA_END=197 /DNA_ORIENTATION=- /assembly_acc=CAM_ASM_000170
MAVAVVGFGISTTALLHFFTKPYVLSLKRLPDDTYEMLTPSIT